MDNVCENQCMMRITWLQHALGFSDADAQILWEACTDACWQVGGSGSSLSGVPLRRSQRRAVERRPGIRSLFQIVLPSRRFRSARNTSIALADQNTACVIVSYEVQAHCVERAGAVVGRFGRKGDGPGEFQSMTEVVRGPGGVVGLRDLRLARLTVFRPGDGDPLAIVAIPPGLFQPLGPFGDMIAGTYTPISGRDLGEAIRLNPRSFARRGDHRCLVSLMSPERIWR